MPRNPLSPYRSLKACRAYCEKKGGVWFGVFAFPLAQADLAKHSSWRCPTGHELVEVHLGKRIFCFSVPFSSPPRKSLGYRDVRALSYDSV